jgi:Uma2 family endonuclease
MVKENHVYLPPILIKNKNIMNTKKKGIKYEFKEEKPTIVEEPLIQYPALNLDLTKRYSYADYLTWIDDKRRELIDGFIYVMSAPVRIHQLISLKLTVAINRFITKKKGKCHIYYAPFDVRLPKDGAGEDEKIYDVVQPDICVVCDMSKLDGKGCIGAPDLIVEVLSPSTMRMDWNRKFGLYEKTGVREYWIVDPKAKTASVFLLQPDGFYDIGTVYDCTEKAPVRIFEGFEIDLNEIFDDEMM